MGMSGDTALIQAKNYVKKTLQGQGALKGQDGFSPTVKENPSNTDNDYRLDITDKNGTFTTPNLKGTDGSGSDYKQLKNKPSIGGVEIDGNKTLDDLGIQPKGEYLTEETDPTVPQWAKENTKPTYTASEVGADSVGSANMALSDAKEYTDNKIAELINGAPETMDTLKEIADALETEQSTVDVLQEAIGAKLNKDGDSKDNTITFVQSETRENIDSGDKHSVLFGKICKWLFDLKEVAFSGSYTDLNNKPSATDIGALPKDGNATSATKATNDGDGNNIAETYATKIQVNGMENHITTNLLKPTLGTTEKNGVTCTANGDGTYTLDTGGSASTGQVSFMLLSSSSGVVNANTKYKLCGCPSGKNASLTTFDLRVSDSVTASMFDFGDGVEFSYEDTSKFYVAILVREGVTLSNVIIRPMITTNLNATYDDFVPYTGRTGQLNSDVAEVRKEVDGVNESLSVIGKCKNLLKPTLGTTEKNGVTCTANGDGTYTLNGTANGDTYLIMTPNDGFIVDLLQSNTLYSLCGCPIGGSVDTFYLAIAQWDENWESKSQKYNTGESIIFTKHEQTKYIRLSIVIRSGTTINNITFKPMITTNLATYDDFVPYTGDGETLTHDVAELNNDLGGLSFSVSDGTLSITDGTNTWTLPQTT